ncbi:MAG: GNAT family N-acetyltransferase [Actinomycetota bacterium]|nr:GNAT family N-acetyltransferase [Actinomycetota bacterium]
MRPDGPPSAAETAFKLAARLRHRGVSEVALLGWGRAGELISSSETLIFLSRSPARDEPGIRADGGLRVRRADASDAPRYARDIGTDSSSTFRHRLTRTTACFVAELDGRLVHASWVTTSGAWTRELQLYVVPPQGESGTNAGADAYVYESFTRPEARGRGAYPRVLRHISMWAAVADLSRVWVAVESVNAASLKAITKAGFSPGFELSFGRRLGRLRTSRPVGPEAAVGRRMLEPRDTRFFGELR